MLNFDRETHGKRPSKQPCVRMKSEQPGMMFTQFYKLEVSIYLFLLQHKIKLGLLQQIAWHQQRYIVHVQMSFSHACFVYSSQKDFPESVWQCDCLEPIRILKVRLNIIKNVRVCLHYFVTKSTAKWKNKQTLSPSELGYFLKNHMQFFHWSKGWPIKMLTLQIQNRP